MNAEQANKLFLAKLEKRLTINTRIAKLFMPLVYRDIKKECGSRYSSRACSFKTLRRYAYIFEYLFNVCMVQNMIILKLKEGGFRVRVNERKWRKSREDYTIIIYW